MPAWARDEFYRWALKASTTTNMTPDEVHEMGQSELEGLHAQMDTILKQAGYAQGSIGDRMKALAEDPEYQFADGDAGRTEIMEFMSRASSLSIRRHQRRSSSGERTTRLREFGGIQPVSDVVGSKGSFVSRSSHQDL